MIVLLQVAKPTALILWAYHKIFYNGIPQQPTSTKNITGEKEVGHISLQKQIICTSLSLTTGKPTTRNLWQLKKWVDEIRLNLPLILAMIAWIEVEQ